MSTRIKKKNKGVLVIYTGGTIGSMPMDMNDLESPQIVVEWEKFKKLTPQIQEENIGFQVNCWPFEEPLDSCNVSPKEWALIARKIEEEYDNYEGFVVLHGTDTMIYTASALSFMLENLGKPVILTGSQLAHLFQARNDALQNLITALMFANPAYSQIPIVPEVCIFFRDFLLRGNRCRKIDSRGFTAYDSPNYPPLGKADVDLVVDDRLILPIPSQPLRVKTSVETNVISFDVFPGIQNSKMVKNLLSDENIYGIIVKSFGSGNIPTDPNFLSLFADARERGLVVLNVTQCLKGKVDLGLYETSAKLLEAGLASGLDITPEAALCKLMFLLGNEDFTDDDVAEECERSLRGEQSLSIYNTIFKFSKTSRKIITQEDKRVRFKAEKLNPAWKTRPEGISTAVLRLKSAKVISPDQEEPVSIKVYVDISSEEPLPIESSINFGGSFSRQHNENATIFSFDITNSIKSLATPGGRLSVTLFLDSQHGAFSWEEAELVFFVSQNQRFTS